MNGEYPYLWQRGIIQRRMYARAGWCCEHCGMEFIEGTTKAKTARRRDGKPFILTVHHIDGNKANCTLNNLVTLCQRCHVYVQYRWQPGQPLPKAWQMPPNWITQRGLAYLPPLQPALFQWAGVGS